MNTPIAIPGLTVPPYKGGEPIIVPAPKQDTSADAHWRIVYVRVDGERTVSKTHMQHGKAQSLADFMQKHTRRGNKFVVEDERAGRGT